VNAKHKQHIAAALASNPAHQLHSLTLCRIRPTKLVNLRNVGNCSITSWLSGVSEHQSTTHRDNYIDAHRDTDVKRLDSNVLSGETVKSHPLQQSEHEVSTHNINACYTSAAAVYNMGSYASPQQLVP